MRLTVSRFRAYVDTVTFEFQPAQLNLIAGASGRGKSTLLEAIYWCLFGSMLHIYPTGTTGHKDTPTVVMLELPELGGVWIRRRRPPETIEVYVPTTAGSGGAERKESKVPALPALPAPASKRGVASLVGDAAQAHIIALFGSKELWMASTYLRQSARCPLLTVSSAEKFQLLHELTFGGGDSMEHDMPDFYTAKVDAEMYRVKEFITTHTGRYNGIMETYTQALRTHRGACALWGTRPTTATAVAEIKDTLAKMEATLAGTRVQHRKACEKEAARKEALAAQSVATQQLAKLQEQVRPTEPLLLRQTELREQLSQAKHRTTLLARRADLTARQAGLPVLPTHCTLSEAEVTARRVHVDSALQCHAKYTALGVHPTTCAEEIATCQRKLAHHAEQMETHKRWETDVAKAASAHEAAVAEHTRTCAQARRDHAVLEQHRRSVAERNALLQSEYTARQRAVILQQQQHARYLRDVQAYEVSCMKREDAVAAVAAQHREYSTHYYWYTEAYPGDTHPERKVHHLHQLLQELACPHCGAGVRHVGPRLEKGTTTPAVREQCTDHITRIQALIAATAELRRREAAAAAAAVPTVPTAVEEPPGPPPSPTLAELPTVPTLLLPPKPTKPTALPPPRVDLTAIQVRQLHERSAQLEALVPPELPLDAARRELDSLTAMTTYRDLHLQLASLTEQLGTDSTAPTELAATLTAALVRADAELTTQHKLGAQITLLRRQVSTLLPPVATPTSAKLHEDISTLELKVKELAALVAAGTTAVDLAERKVQLEEDHSTLMQYAEYESHLTRLKVVIAEVATSAMDTIVSSINVTANLILKELFVDDIRILLQTHRQLKTKDRTKLQVNLQILYRGLEYDSPAQLSGGEQDRISFAITLALAKLNPSPLVLLDECMSALDAGLRERCLKALRVHLPSKTMIHVCHEIVEGFHDHTVRLE